MKCRIHLSLFAIIAMASSTLTAQNGALTLGYLHGTPGTDMRQTIQNTHTFNVGFLMPMKGAGAWEYGFELGVGGYGQQVSDQLYQFDNGDYMYAPVTVRNNMTNGGLLLRYTLPMDAAVTPFAHARVGFARMATRLTIEDPRETHTDECPVPLEKSLLQSGFSFTQGLGAGLSFDMGRIMKAGEHDKYILLLTADYMRGSALEYMSVNAPSVTRVSTEGVESVTLPFATAAQPEVEHRYHSGYLYRTRLELVQLGIHFMVRF